MNCSGPRGSAQAWQEVGLKDCRVRVGFFLNSVKYEFFITMSYIREIVLGMCATADVYRRLITLILVYSICSSLKLL